MAISSEPILVNDIENPSVANAGGFGTGVSQSPISTESIPMGWEAIDLSGLCTLQRGFDITEASKTPGNVPVYSSAGLSYYHNKAMVSPPAS